MTTRDSSHLQTSSSCCGVKAVKSLKAIRWEDVSRTDSGSCSTKYCRVNLAVSAMSKAQMSVMVVCHRAVQSIKVEIILQLEHVVSIEEPRISFERDSSPRKRSKRYMMHRNHAIALRQIPSTKVQTKGTQHLCNARQLVTIPRFTESG